MKRLSDFKDEKGAEVVAKLLQPIMEILQNVDEKSRSLPPAAFLSSLLANNPKSMKDIFAILSDVEPDEYHTDGAEIFQNIISLATDTDFIELFGLQRRTKTSSGSASEISETGTQE